MIIQSKKVWLADQFVPAALELEQGLCGRGETAPYCCST